MSRETGFYIDFSGFDKKFRQLVKNAYPDDARKGLFNAGNELINDAKTKPPQAPFKKGDLHGWGIVEKPEKINESISVTVGFNIKYAHRQHEAEPGAYKYTITAKVTQPGPKFLQSKMAMYFKDYMEIIAETIRRGAK